MLAATDPANAYGAALPWPDGIKAMRAAGAHVVLVDGAMAAYLPRGEGELVARCPRTSRSARGPRRPSRWRWRPGSQRTGRVTLGWKRTGGDGDGAIDAALRDAGFAAYGPGFRYMGRFRRDRERGRE